MKNKFTTLDFRRADLGFFKDLLDTSLWHKALEERGAQENKLIFMDKLLQVQERSISMKRKSGKNAGMPERMNNMFLTKLIIIIIIIKSQEGR